MKSSDNEKIWAEIISCKRRIKNLRKCIFDYADNSRMVLHWKHHLEEARKELEVLRAKL